MEKALDFYREEIGEMKKQIAKIMTEEKEERRERDDQEKLLRKHVGMLQQDKNIKILIISGVPVTDNENLKYLITKLADEIELAEFKEIDIDVIYKTKKVAEKKHPTIVIRFHTLTK